MAVIKIPKKVKTTSSSNETQTLPEKHHSTGSKPDTQSSSLKNIPTPFIDKISILAAPQSIASGKEILAKLNIAAETNGQLVWAKPTSKYPKSFRVVTQQLIAPLKKTKWPIIQFGVQDGIVMQVRIEFSPVDIKGSEMKHLDSVLRDFLPNGWWFFAELGRISMIEVSVDFPLVAIGDINPMPLQTKTAQTWGLGGTLETIVLGKPKGNFFRIYDRGAKRKAKGQHGVHFHATRVERVQRLNGSLKVKDLGKLPNPFGGLKFVSVPSSPPPEEKKPYIWRLFRDAVQLRSLPVALKLLPVEKRTVYRKWLDQHPAPWWSPDEIWKHWPNTVSVDGLDNPEMWIPLPEELDGH